VSGCRGRRIAMRRAFAGGLAETSPHGACVSLQTVTHLSGPTGSPTGRCRCLWWRMPMLNSLLTFALLIALGAAIELCLKVAFVRLLPLLLRLPPPEADQ